MLKRDKKIIIILSIVILGIIGISYAWYTLVINKDTRLNLRAKTNLDIELVEPTDPIVINYVIPMSDADGLATPAYQFKVVNNDTENIAYQLYLDDVEVDGERIPDSNIKYSLTKNGGSEAAKLLTTTHKTVNNKTVREIDNTIINGKTTTAVENSYTLKLWVDSSATNDVAGKKFKAKLRLEAVQTEQQLTVSHIKAVYKYDEDSSSDDYCLGGEEAKCKEIEKPNTYPVGTIVKYEVAPNVEKYFNVIKDNGETLTMQQRENTIFSVAWNTPTGEAGDNSKVPELVLPELEAATSSWTNVNNQTYTAGVTEFGTGDYKTANTACTYTQGAKPNSSSCSTNTYPSFTKTNVKARLITAQEAGKIGCAIVNPTGCKKFMSNYLSGSISNGGTVNDTTHNNSGYWTMTSNASSQSDALVIFNVGFLLTVNTPESTLFGARAVVEVNK